MIFVILGTQKFQFNRLLKYIDEQIESGEIQEDVFAQIGYSDYIPQNYSYVEFLDKEQFEETIKKSDLIITHSGVGSIVTSISAEKPVIVFPRLKRYKEHVDDHQMEIAEAFEKKQFIIKYNEGDSIGMLIKQARGFEYKKYESGNKKIIDLIQDYIDNLT